METLVNMKKYQSLANRGSLKTAPPAEAEVAAAESNELGGVSGYGLRENPKRTWRAVDSTFTLPQERLCKQCGKGFQSLKALCGHMACHSEKDKVLRDSYFWTSENSKLVDSHSDTEDDLMRQTRSKTKRYKKTLVKFSHFRNNNDGSTYVCEVEEQSMEDVAMCLIMLSRDSGNWGGVNSVVESSDNNSVVLETKSSSIDMKTGRNYGLNFADEILEIKKLGDSKLKTSALDTEGLYLDNSSSGYLRNGVKKVESDISIDELLRNGEYKDAELGMIYNRGKHYETEACKGLNVEKEFGDVGISSKFMKFGSKKRAGDCHDRVKSNKKAQNRRKYDCINCNKSFNSFQALGGHRPCHKKTNPTFHLDYESGANGLEDDDITPNSTPIRKLGERYDNKKQVSRDFSVEAKKKILPKKSKGHQCPFCFKMFKSGQALGGHKRTHFINAPAEFHNPTPEIKQEAAAQEATTTRNLIDLNLPAPEQDDEFDDNNQFIYLD